jgi:hypothetical protein
MNAPKSVLVALAISAAGASAFANELFHPNNSEVGVAVHPNHPTTDSGLTRAQVLTQVMGAQRDGTLTWISRGYPPRYPLSGGPALSKTRAQVEEELRAWKANPVTADGMLEVGGDIGWVNAPIRR